MDEFHSGLTVWHFELEDVLDRGETTSLFRAVDVRSETEVALKIVDVLDEEVAERLMREARLYGAIDHPNVLSVYDVGMHEGRVFVSTEFATGGSLAELIEREGPLSEERVASIVEQAASALDALHEQGFVHRAVTPYSVLLGPADHVLLADPFRRARSYAAPEMLRPGAAVGASADVYELGAVAYAALTGAAPDPERPHSVLHQRAGIGPALANVIERAMAPDPAERFASAGELAEAINATSSAPDLAEADAEVEAAEAGPGVPPPPAPAAPSQARRRGAAGLLYGLRLPRRKRGSAGVGAAAPPPPPAGSPAPGDEPPRSAYALLLAPESVVSSARFDVEVGLSGTPVEGVVGEPMKVPAGAYTLTIQIVADGFSLVEGENWRIELQVTEGAAYPSVTVALIAEQQAESVRARTIQAIYSIDGNTIGLAVRPIAVLSDAAQPVPAIALEPGFGIPTPDGWTAPDLTVRILKGKEEKTGRLLWTFDSRHPVDLPRAEIADEIGDDPQDFARLLVTTMPSSEGEADLYALVTGIGNTVADHVPEEFWSLLTAVAEHIDGIPSVLILSAEPYVPWELAVMEAPLAPEKPPFLSAQVRIGRWVLGRRRKPIVPPPMSAEAKSMAVVFGVYDNTPGWSRLEEAEAEAADLQADYQAVPVNADKDAVMRCIEGDPSADVLHFSVHGKYDPGGIQDGLFLVDGSTLKPLAVRGVTFSSPRFVFLNACQVGSGEEVLGDCAGMAEAFLHAGAAGVLAPLWSINDASARRLARAFYEGAFKGALPAELLREERCRFDGRQTTSTYMAYQFFGHPDMTLTR
jgi:hypothetical protein